MGANIERVSVGPRMTQAIVHGGTVYLAGQVAYDTAGQPVAVQAREIFDRIDALLEQAGSHRANLLSVTIFLRNMADYDAFNAAWDDWIRPHTPPARACIEAKLVRPDWAVELIVIAAAGSPDA